MFFPDVVKLLNRLGVRHVNDGIFAQAERVQGGVGGNACAVQAAPSSSLVLPPDCFSVTCKNASMYGKKTRDVHMAGFSVQSDGVVRFRTSDGKVAVADILVVVGKYDKFEDAQEAIYTLIGCYDVKIQDLESLEVDKELDEQVCDC